jgi:hypothetical protein
VLRILSGFQQNGAKRRARPPCRREAKHAIDAHGMDYEKYRKFDHGFCRSNWPLGRAPQTAAIQWSKWLWNSFPQPGQLLSNLPVRVQLMRFQRARFKLMWFLSRHCEHSEAISLEEQECHCRHSINSWSSNRHCQGDVAIQSAPQLTTEIAVLPRRLHSETLHEPHT